MTKPELFICSKLDDAVGNRSKKDTEKDQIVKKIVAENTRLQLQISEMQTMQSEVILLGNKCRIIVYSGELAPSNRRRDR